MHFCIEGFPKLNRFCHTGAQLIWSYLISRGQKWHYILNSPFSHLTSHLMEQFQTIKGKEFDFDIKSKVVWLDLMCRLQKCFTSLTLFLTGVIQPRFNHSSISIFTFYIAYYVLFGLSTSNCYSPWIKSKTFTNLNPIGYGFV